MKTKEIIKTLTEANDWRKGLTETMTKPEIFTIAIDEAIKKLENYKKDINNFNKTSIWALQFANEQKESFDNLLFEVENLLEKWVKPNLIKKVIENGRQRAVLGICLHYDMQVWI